MVYDLTHVCFDGVGLRNRQLPDVVRAPRAPRPAPQGDGATSSGEISELVRRVLEHEGLAPEAYRALPLHRRVPACLRALKVASEAEALARLEANARLWSAAADALLIGVTTFFRDPAVFDAIRSIVLTELARRPRLRAWSAACSTGAELYSLAILLDEAGLLARAELLGTDCRPGAVKEAEDGYLQPAAAAALDPAVRARYVVEGGQAGPRLVRSLREHVHWKATDILTTIEDGPWDIVLWRNSPMYLAPGESVAIFERLATRLGAGGYLVVGKAERPPAGLCLTAVARCVYVKEGA